MAAARATTQPKANKGEFLRHQARFAIFQQPGGNYIVCGSNGSGNFTISEGGCGPGRRTNPDSEAPAQRLAKGRYYIGLEALVLAFLFYVVVSYTADIILSRGICRNAGSGPENYIHRETYVSCYCHCVRQKRQF